MPTTSSDPDLVRSRLGRPILAAMFRGVAPGLLARQLCRLEGGPYRTATLREFLLHRHELPVGAFTYGACLRPGVFGRGARIGRYVSMARGVAWGLNHPVGEPFLHPAFYDPAFGLVDEPSLPEAQLEICADAWIGDHVVITPGCRRIGYGAVVGAGAVLVADVPDFAVAVGVPARVKRLRFPEATCQALLDSRWWERPFAELRGYAELARSAGNDAGLAEHLNAVTRRLTAASATAPQPAGAARLPGDASGPRQR